MGALGTMGGAAPSKDIEIRLVCPLVSSLPRWSTSWLWNCPSINDKILLVCLFVLCCGCGVVARGSESAIKRTSSSSSLHIFISDPLEWWEANVVLPVAPTNNLPLFSSCIHHNGVTWSTYPSCPQVAADQSDLPPFDNYIYVNKTCHEKYSWPAVLNTVKRKACRAGRVQTDASSNRQTLEQTLTYHITSSDWKSFTENSQLGWFYKPV